MQSQNNTLNTKLICDVCSLTSQLKHYSRLCSNMHCCPLQSLLQRNWLILIRRNIISCWRNIIRLMTEVFSDGHNWTESCTDCLCKFNGLSLAILDSQNGSFQPTVTCHSHTLIFSRIVCNTMGLMSCRFFCRIPPSVRDSSLKWSHPSVSEPARCRILQAVDQCIHSALKRSQSRLAIN